MQYIHFFTLIQVDTKQDEYDRSDKDNKLQ